MKLKGSKNSGSNNDNSKVFWIISVLSWLFLLITEWLSIGMPQSHDHKFFWLTKSIKISYEDVKEYNPLEMHIVFHYIVFVLTFVITILGFLVYITYRDDNSILDGMLGKFSKFHFIPLLCISALFIIGESESDDDPTIAMYIFNFFFTVIGLVSLILVRIKTKIEYPWYAVLTIEKGVYSCFLVLLIYNFGFIFTYFGVKEISDESDHKDNWKTACGIIFPIIIGLANLALSIIFKDIIIAIMNLLLYVGMISHFYSMDKDTRTENSATGEGIIDIVMISLSGCTILFLALIYKKSLYNDS